MKFDCPRTCPRFNETWCRFRPVLDKIGPVKINSHTAKVKVEYRDPDSLEIAVKAMGGTWLGQGTHNLCSSREVGHGFNLPGWLLPLVLKDGGELAYDDYKGAWGNVNDLERLKGAYCLAACQHAAEQQGWQTEMVDGALVVHHTSGGILTVQPGGIIDANGFTGGQCHDATMALGLPVESMQFKPEYSQISQRIELAQA